MTRYFFNMQDNETVLDPEGIELVDLKAAREEGIRAFGELIRDKCVPSDNGGPFCLWITDQPGGNGDTLFTVTAKAKSK
jgi:hypothetical protein